MKWHNKHIKHFPVLYIICNAWYTIHLQWRAINLYHRQPVDVNIVFYFILCTQCRFENLPKQIWTYWHEPTLKCLLIESVHNTTYLLTAQWQPAHNAMACINIYIPAIQNQRKLFNPGYCSFHFRQLSSYCIRLILSLFLITRGRRRGRLVGEYFPFRYFPNVSELS